MNITVDPATYKHLPKSFQERIQREGRVEVSFSFSEAEKKVLRKRKPITVSKWAARHRVLTMSSRPGKWKNTATPYLTDIMDAADVDPNIDLRAI